jgi:bacterial leucyl aminopeptidase
MKSLNALLILAGLAAASSPSVLVGEEQTPFGSQSIYPGFDLDLEARRLVQMEGKAPVWITELDKVC